MAEDQALAAATAECDQAEARLREIRAERVKVRRDVEGLQRGAIDRIVRGDLGGLLRGKDDTAGKVAQLTLTLDTLDGAEAAVRADLDAGRLRLAEARRAANAGRLLEVESEREQMLEQAVVLAESLAAVVVRVGELERQGMRLASEGGGALRFPTSGLDPRPVQALGKRATGVLSKGRSGFWSAADPRVAAATAADALPHGERHRQQDERTAQRNEAANINAEARGLDRYVEHLAATADERADQARARQRADAESMAEIRRREENTVLLPPSRQTAVTEG